MLLNEIKSYYKSKYNIIITDYTNLSNGWSSDIKWHIKTTSGDYLLRINQAPDYNACKKMFDYSNVIYTDEIRMAKPISMDILPNGCVCTLLSWMPGNELRESFANYTEQEQYSFGIIAGKYLYILHNNQPCINSNNEWKEKYAAQIKKKILAYKKCGDCYENDEYLLQYIETHMDLLDNRPMVIQHGDYHDGNLVVFESKLGVIDYNRVDIGDPWQEFDKTMWSLKYSIPFTKGMIDGYFNGDVPTDFFNILALYCSVLQISNLPWAHNYNKRDQVNISKQQTAKLLDWFDNFTREVPKWYQD